MKALLGVPTSGVPSAPFVDSLKQLRMPASLTSIDNLTVAGNFVSAQRELIAERALEMGMDALIMCDDDMVLPPDALEKLLTVLANDTACGIVGALYYSRDGFRPMAVDDWDPQNTTSATIPAFTDAPVRVAGIGFGCVAISGAALARLERPFFETHVYIERDPPRVRVCNEDYLFCAKLRNAGYDVVLHAGVRCGHYDRHSDMVMPSAWENPDVTGQRRIAASVNGHATLVPFTQLEPRAERQRSAHLTYVYPQDY